MERSTSQKIKLGIFVVLGTLVLIAALYFIGNRQHLFSKNIPIFAEFENVNGLQMGNNVRYSGINVGTVSKIEMIAESRIIVQMMVEEGTGSFIKKDAIATIGSDGLVGSMVVNILPGKEGRISVVAGDTIASYSRIGADDMLSTLNVTNENAALLTSDLLKITEKILEAKGTLGVLVSDTILAKDIKLTLTNLKETSEQTTLFMKKMNKELKDINFDESLAGTLLSDTISKNRMENIILNLETSSKDIAKVSKNLEVMIGEIKQGEGALNYLTKDRELVQNIDTTMLNIKETSVKLNENMEALKHNFLFRGYFRRMERKERKAAKRN
ncbi:MlaD family protein [Christiangramia salexigens]|uniref:ABC transporter permease n=1 Tax=Christiangramia salexigens TaxID=1913577 RepID=A0A1L3J1N3_9FLAO|nr:MlaD family protein [Christiangramia salexigens]APG59030.1 ABC transporter permease [Christiangramia salexigens]